jgi:hypothetical protein
MNPCNQLFDLIEPLHLELVHPVNESMLLQILIDADDPIGNLWVHMDLLCGALGGWLHELPVLEHTLIVDIEDLFRMGRVHF